MVAVGDAALKETFWVTAVKGIKNIKVPIIKKSFRFVQSSIITVS